MSQKRQNRDKQQDRGGEVKVILCADHYFTDLNYWWPEHRFNDYICYPSRECGIKGCTEPAYYEFIGVLVPESFDASKNLPTTPPLYAVEIFREAKKIMDGLPALDALTVYLRTRIIPSAHREFVAQRLIQYFAVLVLRKLHIDPENSLSDHDKHRIIKELGMYSQDSLDFMREK